MIKTTKKTTTVEFAQDDIGTIAVNGKSNTLTLQELAVIGRKVGEDLKEGDVTELPKIEMNFHNADSVDVMIEALKVIKNNIQYPYGQYCYAC